MEPADPGRDTPPPAQRLWRAGTLTYTTGALLILFAWLLWGDFAYFLKGRSVTPTLKLLLKLVAAPDVVIGVLMGFIPQVLAFVVIPAVGYYSDRHRGRWGRRIPFLLVPTPFVALAMIGLGFSPALGRSLHGSLASWGFSESTCIVLVIGVLWSIYELGSSICDAVFYALFNDVVPKEVMGRFIALFRMVTFLDGVLFNYFIIGHAETHYREIFCAIGVFYGLCFTVMCLRVREGSYPPPPPSVPGQHPLRAIRSYVRDCFSSAYYRWYFVAFALIAVAMQPITLFGLYFSKALGLSMQEYGRFAAVQMGVSFVLSYPVGWLVDRFHAIWVTLAACVLYAAMALGVFLWVSDGSSYRWVVAFGGAGAGVIVTASSALGPLLLPKATFAQYYGAATMVRLVGLALTGPLCGWFFDRFGPDYRYIYLWAAVASVAAAAALGVVYARMGRFGGIKAYVAP